ncbi:MAG: hypothetical protein M3Y57_15695 [Acidobacteriota bacterium]|nr:hypothetical protein [Acidobacteriota bacterium]
MVPNQLAAAQFTGYPPQARVVATTHLAVLQQLPLAFLPLLLRETIAYDWKFPAERRELDHQFDYLAAMSLEQLRKTMAGFAQLRLSPELETVDWVNKPADFSEKLTAHLWATHQIDGFRAASIDYVQKLNVAKSSPALPGPRLAIVVIGQGVAETNMPLFRKLRPYGVHFKNVEPKDGCAVLADAVASRASKVAEPFAHWYIDGGDGSATSDKTIACVSYSSLEAVRRALITEMTRTMQPGGGGPEMLRTLLARTSPEQLGLTGRGDSAVLNKFKISVLTEGSGTQLFSTTFVQWSAREALRRAQPLTLFARFTPRQREESMKQQLAGTQHQPVPDPEGSLVDADMGAYYTWINLQRLPGAENSRFLVWFEDHKEALAIGPSLPRGTESGEPVNMHEIVKRLS